MGERCLQNVDSKDKLLSCLILNAIKRQFPKTTTARSFQFQNTLIRQLQNILLLPKMSYVSRFNDLPMDWDVSRSIKDIAVPSCLSCVVYLSCYITVIVNICIGLREAKFFCCTFNYFQIYAFTCTSDGYYIVYKCSAQTKHVIS